MLPKVFYDKEDHECPGNQNQPDHGKLLCASSSAEGVGLHVASFGLTSISLISGVSITSSRR
jgi:hypothetical protein